ncbi:hypothetical protein ACJJTC_000737 [Scirpophaga incertulas]
MLGLLLSLLAMANLSPVPYIASLLGTTEPALKLLISILFTYPMAYMYHKYVWPHRQMRNLYFIACGFDIAFFNFGMSMIHNLIPALVIHCSTMLLGSGMWNVIITIIFNMTYLVLGYFYTESENYDITWTMPHCVLTLKLIALSFDLWDGRKLENNETLSENCMKTALTKRPGFLELIAFVYFPSCFLIGPLFSFRRYLDFLNDHYPVQEEKHFSKVAMTRLICGLLYLGAFQIGGNIFTMEYMQSEDFLQMSIISRNLYCGVWGHFILYKYISCWLLAEASAIRFGLSYNGDMKSEDKKTSLWDGCTNIKLWRFESATKFQHYIDSFNCNTNHFAAEYIYKRLKFLGNRNLSQGLTLLFLALWHGVRSGYYMTFLMEFLIIYFEKEFEYIISSTNIYKRMWANTYVKYFVYFILKLYTLVFMGWSLVPFDVKVFSKWWEVYANLYFSGFILFVPWAFVYKRIVLALKKAM